ncbi:MAG: nucleotidyltransferase [Nanoarchaeota archaeon]|nr:nucleotidyltransferase [Nanoarchaeota archaeon]MBU1320833.1 nucleotidyltransferase [Nanoarchaeota archaeon]MBU1598056.1 nucleotidyltransferase [Nanoarchaeota archaeon]MBU2441493.1 nucleotidyltransferase [Nanoarchaeota archaeon]
MEFLDKKTITMDKVLNKLDKFVLDFINILKKHSDYVIISGYVSILFGRSRATEDVDLFIKQLDKAAFSKLYKELIKNKFWCLNAESLDEVYSYLKDGIAVRFAKNNKTIPNFEVKFAIKPLDLESFNDRITVKISAGELKISSLERQIAFKRYYLKSDKDIEDALHIEEVFKGKINKGLVLEYRKLIENGQIKNIKKQ